MNERDNLILSHIGLYRITLKKVLDRMFFDGKNSYNVVQRLKDDGHIQSREGLPNNIAYYQLTPSEATARGLPADRGEGFEAQALRQHLGVLWFCTMNEARRHRLEVEELEALDAGFPKSPQIAHCVENSEVPRVWRVEATGPRTGVGGLLGRLTQHIHQARDHKKLGTWIRNRQYAFAVIVEEAGRRRLIDAAIQKHGLKELAEVNTFYAPGHRTLGDALNGYVRNTATK